MARVIFGGVSTGSFSTGWSGDIRNVTISVGDISNCILFWSGGSDTDRDDSDDCQTLGFIVNSTTLRFKNGGNRGDIEWRIVEFMPGEITSQHGETAWDGIPKTVSISSVGDLDDAWCVLLGMYDASGAAYDRGNHGRLEFTNTTTLTMNGAGFGSDNFSWQVVKYEEASEISCQHGTILVSGLSATAVITAVTLNKTLCLINGGSLSSGGSDNNDVTCYGDFSDTTHVQVTRAASSGPDLTIAFSVAELSDTEVIQTGLTTGWVATGRTFAINALNLGRSAVLSTYASDCGCMGQESGAYELRNRATSKLKFNSTIEIQGTRLRGSGTYVFQWQAIEWPGAPINPAVLSVEKFSLSMTNETISTPALSLGQDINNCVPFITISTASDRADSQSIDVAKNVATNKFDIATPAFATDIELEITIVEFDPAEVAIQEVAFTLTNTNTVDITINAVNLSATFPIVYYKLAVTSSNDNFDNHMVRASMETTTNLRLDKEAHADNLPGHAYILEALNGAWEVNAHTFTFASGSVSENATIAVTVNRTAVWSYWDVAEVGDDQRDGVWDAVITDDTNLDFTRGAAGGSASAVGDIEAFVVEFAADVAVVQQGEFNYATSATKTAAITAPDVLGNAMVVGTSVLGWVEGSGITNPKATGMGRLSFNSSTEVLGTRSGTGNGNYRQNFQVIEWLIGTVPPAVLSVEKFTLSMPDATISTPALSKGQDLNNCVPFITVKSDNEANRAQMVDVVKNVGTGKFDFTAHADGTRILEVAIVEFDPAEVNVEELAWAMNGSATDNVTVTAMIERNTFPIIYAQVGSNFDAYDKILFRATFTSATNLLITKDDTQDISGHVYILEAINGAWRIETGSSIPTNYTTNEKTKNRTISVIAAQTAVWSYWDSDESGDDPRDAIWDTKITDDANLDFERALTATPVGSGDIETFIVKFAVGVAVVQQGKFVYGASATATDTITAPGTLANAMVVATNILGWAESAGITQSKAADLGSMEFTSSTALKATRQSWDGNLYEQNWQVIEWLLAGAGGAAAEPFIFHIGF